MSSRNLTTDILKKECQKCQTLTFCEVSQSFPMIPYLTLGSYCSWRCGTFKFKIRFVWLWNHGAIVLTLRVSKTHWVGNSPSQHKSRISELSNDTSFNFGVLLFMEMWHFQVQIRILFGCEVMVPVSQPWESPKPIELVTRPHNINLKYQSFPMIPHSTLGSYCSWRCGTFKFNICSCLVVLLWQLP
jgi:hypothetical protein